MRKIEVKREAGGVSSVVVGDVYTLLPEFIAGEKRVVFITDEQVYGHYSDIIGDNDYIIVGRGEENKTLSTMEVIYTSLLEMGADRHTFIVGLGGGIITDITGFAASTYQRGLEFGFIASTLLSQVDASVGGKNGVNLGGFKNMVGVFNQPKFVICDTQLLKTLPEREIRSGFAEVIKAGVIKDGELFNLLEGRTLHELLEDSESLAEIIYRSISIKARVVSEDERERGERKKLNYGHTFAHAIEKSSRQFIHGEAVAIGMEIASQLAIRGGYFSEQDAKRISAVSSQLGFSLKCGLSKRDLFELLKSDKKRNANTIDFVFPTSIGSCEVVNKSFDDLGVLVDAISEDI